MIDLNFENDKRSAPITSLLLSSVDVRYGELINDVVVEFHHLIEVVSSPSFLSLNELIGNSVNKQERT